MTEFSKTRFQWHTGMESVPSDINSKKDLRKLTKIQEEDSTNDPLSGREDLFFIRIY